MWIERLDLGRQLAVGQQLERLERRRVLLASLDLLLQQRLLVEIVLQSCIELLDLVELFLELLQWSVAAYASEQPCRE